MNKKNRTRNPFTRFILAPKIWCAVFVHFSFDIDAPCGFIFCRYGRCAWTQTLPLFFQRRWFVHVRRYDSELFIRSDIKPIVAIEFSVAIYRLTQALNNKNTQPQQIKKPKKLELKKKLCTESSTDIRFKGRPFHCLTRWNWVVEWNKWIANLTKQTNRQQHV